MKINPNLLPKQGDEGKFVQYTYPFVGKVLKNYIGQKITISCDIESTHDDTEVLVYPYQNSGISIDNVQKSYTVGKTKKRIVDVRTVTQHPSNINSGAIMFYNSDATKKIKITNIKIELGTEATMWIPHRGDLNEAQATLMPEHLFGGGYRLEGDSSDIATDRWWQYEGIAQSIAQQQECHFKGKQQSNQRLCEDTRRGKCLSIYSDSRHRTFDLYINISDRFSRTNCHSISLDSLISRFKASLLTRRGHEPTTRKRCVEKIKCYFNGWRKYEITKLDGEGYGSRRLHRREGRIYGECGRESSRYLVAFGRRFTARKTTTLPAIRDLLGDYVNLTREGAMA